MAFLVGAGGSGPFQVAGNVLDSPTNPPLIGKQTAGAVGATYYVNIVPGQGNNTAGATQDIDPEVTVQKYTLTQNCTFQLLNYTAGHSVIFAIDRTASLFTVSGFTNPSVLWPNGATTASTFSQLSASRYIVVTLIDIAATWYGTATGY
jgi:hypothetical protein